MTEPLDVAPHKADANIVVHIKAVQACQGPFRYRDIATGYHAEYHPKALLLIYVLSSLDRSLPFVGVRQPISLLLLSLSRHMNVAHTNSILEMQERHHRQHHKHCYSAMLLHRCRADRLITAARGNLWHDEAVAMCKCYTEMCAVTMTLFVVLVVSD